MEKDLVDSISVKSPCDESWDEMVGTNEVRFCSHCAKNVHNISAITREEIKKLVEKSNGKLCVRYIKNPQGKILTRPPQTIKIKRQSSIAAGVLATSLTLSALAYAQNQQISAKDNSQQTNKSERKYHSKLHLFQRFQA